MDKFYGIKKSRNLILPVIFSREKPTDVLSAHFINEYNRLNNDNRKKVVFTASFDFFPNIDA
ncbi:glycosyltransferase, partial [Escherichia coli]